MLQHGPKTPLELSRALNLDRSKIYRSVAVLTQKRLLEESHAAWGKKLQAASPTNLKLLITEEQDMLEAKKHDLPALMQGLGGLPTYSKKEFEVKHYRGQEGLRQMLWNHLAAKKEILAFSYKNKNDIVGKTFAEKIRLEQLNRGLMLYEVENETDQGSYWYTDVEDWPDFYESRYIHPKVLHIKQYIAVFNDTVAIMNWHDGDEIGIEIINATYADMERQRFWAFWEIADQKN